jgi:hypothetical protein
MTAAVNKSLVSSKTPSNRKSPFNLKTFRSDFIPPKPKVDSPRKIGLESLRERLDQTPSAPDNTKPSQASQKNPELLKIPGLMSQAASPEL